jgi:hypothetical protein
MTIDPASEAARPISYAYKASLIGSAHQFELTDAGLSWQIAGKSGVWAYADIAAIRNRAASAPISKTTMAHASLFSRPPGKPSR